MSQPILSVAGLEAFYGPTQVLHGCDFEVQAGGITALLGANGAGKTTTLRAISGMVRTRGRIRFEDRAIEGVATETIVRQGIAHDPLLGPDPEPGSGTSGPTRNR